MVTEKPKDVCTEYSTCIHDLSLVLLYMYCICTEQDVWRDIQLAAGDDL